MLPMYLPAILGFLLAAAAVPAFLKQRDTPTLLLLCGFVILFLSHFLPLLDRSSPYLVSVGVYLGWLTYVVLLTALLFMTRGRH